MRFASLSRSTTQFPGHVNIPDRMLFRKLFSLVWILLRAEGEPLERLEQCVRTATSSYEYETEVVKIAPDIYGALEYLAAISQESPLKVYAEDIIRRVREERYLNHEGKFRITESNKNVRTIQHHPFSCTVYASGFDCNALSLELLVNSLNVSQILSEYLELRNSLFEYVLAYELYQEDIGYVFDVFEFLDRIGPFIGKSFDSSSAVNVLCSGFDQIREISDRSCNGALVPCVAWPIVDEGDFWYMLDVQIHYAHLLQRNGFKLILTPVLVQGKVFRPTIRMSMKRVRPVRDEGDVVLTPAPFIGSEMRYVNSVCIDIIDSLKPFMCSFGSPRV